MTSSWRVLVTLTIGASTLAFGAVYPWGYYPLFVIAAAIGVAGLARGSRNRRAAGAGEVAQRVDAEWRTIGLGICLLLGAVALQCVPFPALALQFLTPHATDLLEQLNLTFAGHFGPHPMSIAPGATFIALAGLVSLSLYLTGLPMLLTGRDVRKLPRELILFAVPLALFGIVSRERNNELIYWFWQPVDGTGSNAFGPFVNRNHFAGWMVMALCLALGALFGMIERGAAASRPGMPPSSRERSRIVLTAAGSGLMTLSLMWTMSRSAMVSLACALLCMWGLVARRERLGITGRRMTVAMLVLLVGTGACWRGPGRLGLWFADTTDFQGRLDAWRDGWQVVRQFPLTGTGLNTYPIAMLFHQRQNQLSFVAQAHNDYLQLLAEGGLLVVVPALIAAIGLALAIWRNLSRAQHETRGYWIRAGAAVGLIAMAVQETAEFSLQIPANAFLFCTLAGLALAPVESKDERRARLRPVPADSTTAVPAYSTTAVPAHSTTPAPAPRLRRITSHARHHP